MEEKIEITVSVVVSGTINGKEVPVTTSPEFSVQLVGQLTVDLAKAESK